MKYSFLAQDDDQLASEAKHSESKERLKNFYFSTKTSNYNKAPADVNNTI